MAATKLYAFWELSGNPPSPWYKVATYNDKFVRSTSNTSSALSTGGNLTHTHSLGSGHTVSTTNDLTNVYLTPGTSILQSYGTGHNHSIGTVAIAAASNSPSYYTLSLIAIDLYEFINSQRRLPKGAVVASTASISESGYSRLSAADGKLIKLTDTPGSSYENTTHTHGFTGSLSYYQSSAGQTLQETIAVLFGAIGDTHTHGVSSLSTSSQTLLPSRIQTRLYEVTADPYTSLIPINTVLFVDGSITGYTNYFETIAAWNDRFIESADSDPTQVGSDIHNHGTSTSGASDISDRTWGGAKSYGSSRAISRDHVHNLTIYINSTDVDHKPPYVYLAAVRVKASILTQQTKTKAYSMKTLLQKKNLPKSYGMDIRFFKPGNKYYNMGIFLQKGGLTKSISMDMKLLIKGSKSYDADIVLKRKNMSLSYQMGLAPLFLKGKKYEMGIRLINPEAIPRYSVIDTLQDSFISQYNKFLQTVESSKISLKIESASGYDLERRWGRAFDLPRDPGETDTQYRSRLMSYMSSVVGCGTRSAIKAALDVATGGSSARVDSYPGLVRVNFDSDYQRRAASERKSAIEKILNFSVAAGIQWILYLPFKDYYMSILLRKERLDKSYDVNMLLQKKALQIEYAMDLVICSVRQKSYTADMLLEKTCDKNYRMFMRLKRIGLEPYEMDMKLIRKSITVSYIINSLLMKHCSKLYYMKMILEKFNIEKKYIMDMRLTKTDYKLYKVAVILKKKFDISYAMDLLVASGRQKAYTMDVLLANEIHKNYDLDMLLKKEGGIREPLAAKITDGVPEVSLALGNGKIWVMPCDFVPTQERIWGIYKDIDENSHAFNVLVPAGTDMYTPIEANLCDYTPEGTDNYNVTDLEMLGEAEEITNLYYDGSLSYNVYIGYGDNPFPLDLITPYKMDILLANERSVSLDADIILKKSVERVYTMDIMIMKTLQAEYAMDLRLKSIRSKTYLIDIYLKARRYNSYTMDLQIKKEDKKIYYVDLLLKRDDIIKSYSMGLKIRYLWNEKSYRVDMLLMKELTKSYAVDIYLMQKKLVSYTMDLQIKKEDKKTYYADLLLKKNDILKSYSMGLRVRSLWNEKNYKVDMLLMKELTESYAMDIYLMQRRLISYTMDLQLKKVNKKNYSMDTLLINRIHKNYNLDMLLKKEGGIREPLAAKITDGVPEVSLALGNGKIWVMPCDFVPTQERIWGIYKDIDENSHAFNVLVPAGTDMYTPIEANLCDYTPEGTDNYNVTDLEMIGEAEEITNLYYDGQLSYNVYIGYGDNPFPLDLITPYKMDILLANERSVSLDTDIVLRKSVGKIYTVHIMIAKPLQFDYSMDLRLKSIRSKTYLTDIYLKARRYNSYTMDLQIKKEDKKIYYADLLLKRDDIIKSYSMGLRVRSLWNEKSYRVDTLLMKKLVKSYAIDIYLMQKGSSKYIMNLMVKKDYAKQYGMGIMLEAAVP